MRVFLDFSWVEIFRVVELAIAEYEERTNDNVKFVMVLDRAELFISDFGLPLFSPTEQSAKEIGCVVVSLKDCPAFDFGWLGVLKKLNTREIPMRTFKGENLCVEDLVNYLVEIGESKVLH